MDLDTLKTTWAEHDRKLDLVIRLNFELLRSEKMKRVRWPMRRFAFLAGLGCLPGLAALSALGRFIFDHWREPRFALPAALLDVWLVAAVAAAIAQLALALRIDYDEPVARIQRQIEFLRMFRIRTTQWSLLTGQLVWWIPAWIVGLKAFGDVDAYRVFGPTYLLVNLAVGLAIIPLVIWASRKLAGRMARSRLIERLLRDLAGYNLNAAAGFLATLSEFESGV